MNAATPTLALEASPLPLLAVQNIEVLQALHRTDVRWESAAALAAELGRDKSNLSKTLHKLCEEGLCVWPGDAPVPELDRAGVAAVEAWARANGAPGGGDGETLIPFDLIDPWPDQPRQFKDEDVIEDMAVSIGEDGVLQAITVRPSPVTEGRYQVVIGETRRASSYRAVELGLQPADFRIPAKVRKLTDAEAFRLALIENVQRNDLHWADEARALHKLQTTHRYSANEMVGILGKRKKRSIQDYTKIARELAPEILAKAYLPPTLDDGKPNPECLTYVKARQMVGDKAPPPTLDLSPGERCTLLELISAVKTWPVGGSVELRLGEMLTVVIHAEPANALLRLSRHAEKLITLGFEHGRDMVVRVAVSEKLVAWLDQIGFLAAPTEALFKARAAVLGGDLQANAHPPHRFLTPELNAPEAPHPAPEFATPFTAPDTELREIAREIGDAIAADDAAEEEEEIPAYLRRLAGGGEPPPAAPRTAPPLAETEAPAAPALKPAAPKAEELPPMLAIILVELAHKIGRDGIERGPGTWAAPVLAGWHEDKRNQQLTGLRLIAFMAQGDRTLATLTKHGLDWLRANCPVVEAPVGKPNVADHTLRAAHSLYMGAWPRDEATYHTPWLNPPEAARQEPETPPPEVARVVGEDAGDAAADLPRGEGEADREAASALPAPEPRAHQLADVQRALLACYGQLGQLDNLISRLRAKAGATHQAEIDQHRRLIEAVRETAKANLPEDVFHG